MSSIPEPPHSRSEGEPEEGAQPVCALVVEDFEDDVLLLCRKLRRGGIEIRPVVAETEKDVITALDQGEIEIIFSDSNIPGFGAENLVRLCRDREVSVPLIIVSGMIEGLSEEVLGFARGCVSKEDLSGLASLVRAELGR